MGGNYRKERESSEAGILPLNYSRPSAIPALSSFPEAYLSNSLSIQSVKSPRYPLFRPKNRQ